MVLHYHPSVLFLSLPRFSLVSTPPRGPNFCAHQYKCTVVVPFPGTVAHGGGGLDCDVVLVMFCFLTQSNIYGLAKAPHWHRDGPGKSVQRWDWVYTARKGLNLRPAWIRIG